MDRSVQRVLLERLHSTPAPVAAPIPPGGRPEPGVRWTQSDIIFSACNEDTGSEIRALRPAGKRVLCVTAGGGRVLSLLGERPREVWCVDLNPCQNHLLELKVAAMRLLEHDGYLRFLGVRPSDARLATYEGLRPRLTPEARTFFDRNPARLERGIIYEGKLERHFKRLAVVLKIVRPFGLDRLFGFDDLSEQRRFLRRFDTPLFRIVAHNLLRREVFKHFSGDPGFYQHLPADLPLEKRLWDNIVRHFGNHLARENHVLGLAAYGRYPYEPALPPYLNAAHYDRIRAGLAETSLTVLTGRVDQVLGEPDAGSFDAFSLSDVSSYLDDADLDRLFETVLESARPGARLCSRGCIIHRELSPEQARRIRRDHHLEHQFGFHDYATLHQFLVGEVA
jgi:S-adenosylmethionine-diacylglycerol 3-amino-3-carboxypropyl transferase